MYDELLKRLRDAAKMSEALAVLLPHSEGNATAKLFNEAADAIEELSKSLDDMNEANIALYGALPKWIPVTERLPEKDGAFITAYSKGGVSQNWYMPFHHGGGKWYQNSEDTGEVTHWMPLPQPPKEE